MSWKKRTYILKKREDRLLGKSSECDTKKKKENIQKEGGGESLGK